MLLFPGEPRKEPSLHCSPQGIVLRCRVWVAMATTLSSFHASLHPSMDDLNPIEGSAPRREVMVERLVLRAELGLIRAAGAEWRAVD